MLEKTRINDHCMLVSALGSAGQRNKQGDSDEVISYLKFSRVIPKYAQRTVDIAFPIKIEEGKYNCIKNPSPYVSVYFPTETESKLDFIVQGPYRTTPNRSSIPADDEDNKYLAKETAMLLKDSINELKEAGKFNMSFVRAMPLVQDRFNTFGLFRPLFETVRNLFKTTTVIPTKDGGYVLAKYAKVSRPERLTAIFSDSSLSDLINDGGDYSWLPTYITENNREYQHVHKYLTSELGIQVIRPEDLRPLFDKNPGFLPRQTEDWIVDLYGLFEDIPASFSRTKNDSNLLTTSIVKTSKGTFVAPYRREGKTYIPNVFLPSDKIHSDDINFVDEKLYRRCSHFFDNVLQIQKPNEYEFIIKDIKKRYESGWDYDESRYIEDVKALLKYSKYEEYREEVSRIIKEHLVLKCKDGEMRNAYSSRLFLPISEDGINIEAYYRNVVKSVFFVDVDFYSSYDISVKMLSDLGVKESIIVGDNVEKGTYDTGSFYRQPEWWTSGDFRWKLSADALKDVLSYISVHSTARDALQKSQAIMKLLVSNESKLCGLVHISGNSYPNLEDEPCEMIHILRGDRTIGWDGRWLFSEAGELISPKSIYKNELNTALYGRIRPDSIIFDLLDFRKTRDDEGDELRKTIPPEKLDAFFESELMRRFGLRPSDINEIVSIPTKPEPEPQLPFPVHNVKNWEALKKHSAEMLVYADPVRYENVIRHIRVSNHPKEARAYLLNMYKHEGSLKCACQLCHETCASIETTEIFLKPETELDPINLCLCPNCAAIYRNIRTDQKRMAELRKDILSRKQEDITSQTEHVAVALDNDDELWFTQTHFAEVQELLRLTDEVKNGGKNKKPAPKPIEEEKEKSGVSVYAANVGKVIRRKDGFEGVIKDFVQKGDDEYYLVDVRKGKDAGKETRIQLAFILSHKDVYTFSEE